MRLRRSDPTKPGLRRVRRGRGFSYLDGDVPVEPATQERIEALVIPPAWREVWISPHHHGHIQAMGTDEAGRRQYLYHPDWHEAQNKAKHERVRQMAARLPAFREAVDEDLRRPGLGSTRICAVQGSAASGSSPPPCGCSTPACSGPVGTSTPRRTAPRGRNPAAQPRDDQR